MSARDRSPDDFYGQVFAVAALVNEGSLRNTVPSGRP